MINKKSPLADPYDEFEYYFSVDKRSYPGLFAIQGLLHGLTPPPIENARILDIGCAQGASIISFAHHLPQSQCLGIELSQKQTDDGNKLIKQLGLNNVSIRQGDFSQMNLPAGSFDYIYAHGVYSWIPTELQPKMLQFIKHCLAPNGIAYVSYNVWPGWHLKYPLRELLMYHTRDQKNHAQKAQEAHDLLKLLSEDEKLKNLSINTKCPSEVNDLASRSIHYLAHEQLEPNNNPIFHRSFTNDAESHNLVAFADAIHKPPIHLRFPYAFKPHIKDKLKSVADWEQYYDFTSLNTFRATLLCHDNIEHTITPKKEALKEVYFSTPLRTRQRHINLKDKKQLLFIGSRSEKKPISAKKRLTKAILWTLATEAPSSLSFNQLFRYMSNLYKQEKLKVPTEDMVLSELLDHYYLEKVQCWMHPLPVLNYVNEKPAISKLARHFSERTQERVPSQHFDSINFPKEFHSLIQLLDGTRTEEELSQQVDLDPKTVNILLRVICDAGLLTH